MQTLKVVQIDCLHLEKVWFHVISLWDISAAEQPNKKADRRKFCKLRTEEIILPN